MGQTKLRVELLAHTPKPLSLIYAAFRQCYHAGFVADMWPKLLSGDISWEKQADFVDRIVASGHVSPIEHVVFTFAVEGVSRALSHQLVRHRIASFSQQSQRYVDGENFNYIMPPVLETIPEGQRVFAETMEQIGKAYQRLKVLLDEAGFAGHSKEDARFVLPQAAETCLVFSMNCRSLLNFFELRCCARAQWEIRALAQQMLQICRQVLPSVFAVAGAKCNRLKYCPEGAQFTCGRYPLREEDPSFSHKKEC